MGGTGADADLGVSSRGREVLTLLGEQLTNQEIGSRLYISVRTVESHVSSLLRKLEVADRRALAHVARDMEQPKTPHRRLPAPLTSFIGRVAERAGLAEALGESRLVTAVGPGGVGKTRLALAVTGELAARFTDGAWYVDLVPVSDPEMVAPAVAAALGLGEHPRLTPEQVVTKRFGGREALLVLDNCEHVVDGVSPFVERLLTECSSVTVLATSRARLILPFERVFEVPGLAVSGDSGSEGDAVALFRERAGIADSLTPDQQRHVVAVCSALDGMALAIELAAARFPALGLDGLESGLADQLRLLTGRPRADDRHQSLRATLDWSYALLDPVDRAVLRRVSVFASPFTADAAAQVAESELIAAGDVADTLARLAERSLLTVVVGAAGTRYRMLETIRQYGEEQLAADGEHDRVRAHHVRWCLAAAAECDGLRSGDGRGWRAAFDDVADELRAALGWAADQPAVRDDGHQLARQFAALLFARGMPTEAQRRYEQAAAVADGAAKVDALALAGGVAFCRISGDDMLRFRRAAATTAEACGLHAAAAFHLAGVIEVAQRFPGIVSGPIPTGEELAGLRSRARQLVGDDPLACAAVAVAEAFDAYSPFDEDAEQLSARAVALARASGDPVLESAALDQLTALQLARGRIGEAHASCRRRLELLGSPPHDPHVGGEFRDATHMAALISIGVGDLRGAGQVAEQRSQLSFYSEEGDLAIDWLIVQTAVAGELDEAVALGERYRSGWERAGRPSLGGISATPYAMVMAHALRGDETARAEWLEIHTTFRRAVVAAGLVPSPTHGTFYAESFDAIVLLHDGDVDEAVTTLAVEPESFDTWNTAAWRQWYAALWAESALLAGLPEAADRIARASKLAEGNPIAAAIVGRTDALRRGDQRGLVGAAAALQAAGCRYQWARTLVLAGGDLRKEAEAAMAALGAKPMAVP